MDLFTIITHALALTAGAFLGVLLGRRSTGANAFVDRVQKEADELRNKLALAEAKLRDKGK